MARRLIVLDVDDTLYLERDYARSGFAAVGRHLEERYGIGGFADRAWQIFQQGGRGNIFDQALADLPEADVSVADLVRVYREHRPAIALIPDARDYLDRASGHVNLAVVTDGPAASQRAKIDALGLSRWIDEFVVTAERGADWVKPSVRSFAYLQELFGAEAADCVYYGDNPAKDFVGPAALGWSSVRVRRPGGLHYAEKVWVGNTYGGADRTVADLSEELT